VFFQVKKVINAFLSDVDQRDHKKEDWSRGITKARPKERPAHGKKKTGFAKKSHQDLDSEGGLLLIKDERD